MITVCTKPKTFIGAKYTPIDSYYDSDIQEVVDVYEITGPLIVDGSGSVCEFVGNNALIDNPEQFGIKYAWGLSKSEMHNIFTTQNKAAEVGAAPPVHRLVKIIHHCKDKDTSVFWGYTTSVAECKHNLVYGEYLQAEYEEYCLDYTDEADRYCSNILKVVGQANAEYFPDSLTEDLTDLVKGHFLNVDPLNVEEWAANKGYIIVPDRDIDELLNCLSNIIIIKDCGQEYCLGGDLHSGNLAMWQGNIVCIDFSYHALVEV